MRGSRRQISAENRTGGSGKSTGEGHSAGTAPSRARTPSWNVSSSSRAVWAGQTCLSTAPQPEPCTSQGRERRGRRDSDPTGAAAGTRNKGLAPPGSCRRLWGGAELGLAQTLPVVLLQCQTLRERPQGLPGRLCGSRGSKALEVLLLPLHCHVPRSSRAERAWALPLLSSPCSKGQCPSALDQRWKQLQARALMKPALESLSLGKGGVIQHQQLSGAAPALAVVPRPPPSPSQALHEQQPCSPCPQRGGFLLHCTLSNMSRPPQFHLAQHSTLPRLLCPAAPVDFSMKHDFPSHCHLPRDGITELLPGLAVLGLQQPPVPGNPGSGFPTRASKTPLMGT